MKQTLRNSLLVLLLAAMAGSVVAQETPAANNKIAGVKSLAIDVHGNPISGQRSGNLIWDNRAVTAWWTITPGDLYLDWGELQPRGLAAPLVDHVIDGFTFTYATNNMEQSGESFSALYFDSCTGGGDLGVQEAAFIFNGLPNGYGLPPLPPGYAWIFSIDVDIEGSGYEFLLNDQFGQAFRLENTPGSGGTGLAIGDAPGMGGNGPTGTENAFDWYDSSNNYLGTYYFGAYPPIWATWPGALYGDQDPALNMSYFDGTPPNSVGLYAVGDFSVGGNVHFMVRLNGSTDDTWLGASFVQVNWYNPKFDTTRLIKPPLFYGYGAPWEMKLTVGDYKVYDISIPPEAAGLDIYFQAGIFPVDTPPPRAEASNGLHALAP